MTGQPIRILIVDDHTLFRESLARLLEVEPDIQVAGNCATVADAREILARGNADVILLDYDLDSELGVGLLRHLQDRGDAAKILFVTAGMPRGAALEVLSKGTSGIMLKHGGPGQLLDAIHRVAGGGIFLDRRVLQSMDPNPGWESGPISRGRAFTGRQQEVLRGILGSHQRAHGSAVQPNLPIRDTMDCGDELVRVALL